MDSWEEKKLGEIIELKYGKGIPQFDRSSNGKYPIYGANGILGWTDKAWTSGEAIIVGRKGSAGEITRVSGYFWPSDVTYYVMGNEYIDVNFLFYLLKNLNLKKLAVGVKPGINRNKVYDIEISLPPLETQKRIVAKIEELFAKIDEAKRLREESQKETANLLPAALHKIFEEGKKKGWSYKSIKEICDLNPQKSEIKALPNDLEVSFVPMAAVDEYSQSITVKNKRKLGEVRSGYTYFKNQDVLFAKITPCMENGKVAIAKNLINGIGFGTTEFHVLRAKNEVLPKWIYSIIRQPSFRKSAESRMTGSAGQKRVPKTFLEDYKIPFPSLSEQRKIIEYLDSLSERTKKIQELQAQTAEELKELQQSILHKAFSGELV